MQIFLRLLVLTVFITNAKTSLGQSWQWANSIGVSEGDVFINEMAKLSNDEIVATGSFEAPSIQIGNDILEGKGMSPLVFILNKNGEYRKAIKFGADGEDFIIDVVTDKEDNIYVAGNFKSLLFFVGNDTLVNQGNSDVFIVKLDNNLNVIWTKTIATAFVDELVDINIDSEGNVYVASLRTITSSTENNYIGFLTKISTDNTTLWTIKVNTTKYITFKSLLIDNDDNCYWLGEGNDLFFEDGQSVEGSNGEGFGFVLKLSASGDFIENKWLKSINNAYLKDQNIYVLQNIYDSLEYNIIGIRALKYDLSLAPIWQNEIKNIQLGYYFNSIDNEMNISVDDEGGVYLVGGFYGDSLIFAQDTLRQVLNDNSNALNMNTGIYLFKYNKEGEEVWAKNFGKNLYNKANSVLVYGDDELIIAGVFQEDSLQFGDFNIFNDNETDTLYLVHGLIFIFKPIYAFIASFDDLKTGIHQFKSFQTQLYPNPVDDAFTLVLPLMASKIGSINIFDMSGRLVKNQTIFPGESNIQINVKDLATGIHIVQLQIGEEYSNQKFVKH